jgi:hypothetical protein
MTAVDSNGISANGLVHKPFSLKASAELAEINGSSGAAE